MTLLQHELTDFTVQAFQNNDFHEVTKADVLGHWSLFFFYPADFTFVCPTELEDLADHDANEKIAKIQYPMLADPTALLARDLDTYNEELGQAERGDFIINPEGKVVAYEVISSNVGRNAEELLRRVQASQFVYEHGDQVCPAKWEPGEATIAPSLDLVGHLCPSAVWLKRFSFPIKDAVTVRSTPQSVKVVAALGGGIRHVNP